MIARRGFLAALLALGAAPAIVRASSLMPIKAPKVWVPEMEIGVYEGFRFIESPVLALTIARIRQMAAEARVASGVYERISGDYIAFAHSPSVVEEMLKTPGRPFKRP